MVEAGGLPLFATPWRIVDVTDPAAEADAIAWWTELTGRGGEGMVVKPLDFIVRDTRNRLVQPALKVRGREYLRIIYGPEYTHPDYLQRLRSRAVGAKRSLAAREFALGIEGLDASSGANHSAVSTNASSASSRSRASPSTRGFEPAIVANKFAESCLKVAGWRLRAGGLH
jgi:hypothetical protein